MGPRSAAHRTGAMFGTINRTASAAASAATPYPAARSLLRTAGFLRPAGTLGCFSNRRTVRASKSSPGRNLSMALL
jgi:hypothetical protein